MDIDTPEVKLGNNSIEIYKDLFATWQGAMSSSTREIMKKYIQADLALNLFPYGRTTVTLYERSIILAFKFAFIRLALITYIPEAGVPLAQDTTVMVIQGISRYLNHIKDFKLLLSTCRSFGWFERSYLAGMLYSYG